MACVLNQAFWIYLICLVGFIMIIRLVVPWMVNFFGFPAPIPQVIMIVLWVVIACAGIYFVFGLFSCLFSGGGVGGALTFPHGR
jgi:hypothetical protein